MAAHIGQTDVRITAKADTEEEADTLVAGMEEKLRERLGVAVYGVGKVTVAEVVGDLMQEKSLKIGVVDTLTGGQLARDLVESGYSDLVATDLAPANLAEALKDSEIDVSNPIQMLRKCTFPRYCSGGARNTTRWHRTNNDWSL